MRWLKKHLIIAAFPLSCATAFATDLCSDVSILTDLPTLDNPVQKDFRYWSNRRLAANFYPTHMAHDAIVKTGQDAVVVGKFDYDKFFHKDLEGEFVHAYIYGEGLSDWQHLGKYKTDSDGKVYVTIKQPKQGQYAIRFVVEGDLSTANGYLSVVPEGRKTILFDIDGTLTLNDIEGAKDYLGLRTALSHSFAVETVNAYAQKHYQIVYLTGRPYWIARDTRDWFDSKNLLPWHLHTDPFGDGPFSLQTEAYKIDYIRYLKEEVGLDIVRAYGNASTDISAYEKTGIDKANTFIIGENAGNANTQALGSDYSLHYATVVQNTPAVDCS